MEVEAVGVNEVRVYLHVVGRGIVTFSSISEVVGAATGILPIDYYERFHSRKSLLTWLHDSDSTAVPELTGAVEKKTWPKYSGW